jgi:transcriptional regulator with XRE-family HTH domain|tara:strand:+ start:259 stop:645 length:387 start_codon:yes stop_codon:yes gene_type:complete
MGLRIKDRRKAMKLSLDALAARSGLSKSYIWEIENGKNKNPTIRTAFTLARALGWSLSEIVGLWEHGSLLHPEAMRIATEIDVLLRPAQAIEARSGETACGLDPKEESAVRRMRPDTPARTPKGESEG